MDFNRRGELGINQQETCKEVDFSSVETFSELYQLIRDHWDEVGPPQSLLDNADPDALICRTPDDAIDCIKLGVWAILPNERLIKAVRRLLAGDFSKAETWDQLITMINGRKVIKGSHGEYTVEQIIKLVYERRFDFIPNTDGLRKTVIKFCKEIDKLGDAGIFKRKLTSGWT